MPDAVDIPNVEAILLEHEVTPWTGLPLWIPAAFTEEAGFMEIDCSKAQHAGLPTRSLTATVADTAAWLAGRDNAAAWNEVLSADAEREILAAASGGITAIEMNP